MDELAAVVAARTGIDPGVARKAVTIILGFLVREARTDKVGDLVDAIPGAREAIGLENGSHGIMGAFTDLTAAGIRITQIQPVARALVALSEEKAGRATVEAIVGSVPGLRQFV